MKLFVSFEGVEGSGKTTQVEMLHNLFVDMRIPVIKTREPGGTALGDRLRAVLLQPSDVPFSAFAETLLYMAARAQLVKEIIAPALDHHTAVITDRYVDSTIAYQGYGRGIDTQLIHHLNEVVTGGWMPRMTVLLDVDPQIGLARISSRPIRLFRDGKDRMESESLEFHRRVRKGYLTLAERHPERFLVVNGADNKDRIHRFVVQELMRRCGDILPRDVQSRVNLSQCRA